MRTILSPTTTTYEIQKSKFIGFLFPVTNTEMVQFHLDEIRKNYPDATHQCYAYILKNEKRCSDDGEPSGTAGMPILNVLEKQGLNFILCIVVRYFGGVLLGAGGLVRAYTTSATKTLSICSYVDMVEGKEIQITFSYENQKYIDPLLKNVTIHSKQYQEQIKYNISISTDIWNSILNQILPYLIDYQIIKDCYCLENTI